MGLPPDDDSYPPGDECLVCVDELFGGVTPKYVNAIVHDLEKCLPFPVWAEEPPDGVILLTQTTPCAWQFISPTFMSFAWSLEANRSNFAIIRLGFKYFESHVADKCYDAFPNELVCGEGPHLTEGGYVTCWWGPGIGKGPIA